MGWYEDLMAFLLPQVYKGVRFADTAGRDFAADFGQFGLTPEGGPKLYPPTKERDYDPLDRVLSNEYVVPFEKPSRYSGGYSEKFASGGTLNIGRMTPDWAPRDSSDVDAEQLGSIMTTSALQNLVTNKPVNPQYGIGMAAIKNALTAGEEEDRLGREAEKDLEYKEYLRGLERSGKITAKEALDYLVKAAGATTTPLGADPEISSELKGRLSTSSGGARGEGMSIVRPGLAATEPTEFVAKTPGGAYEVIRKDVNGRQYGRRTVVGSDGRPVVRWFDVLTGEEVEADEASYSGR